MKMARFRLLAETFSLLEKTSSSLKMIDILADFFAKISPNEAKISAYFLRGEVAPPYRGADFGLAKKLAMRSIARAANCSPEKVEKLFGQKGDLGDVAENLLSGGRGRGLSLVEVFEKLKEITQSAGPGSQEEKIALLTELISRSPPLEAKYLVRLVLGVIRLGVAEMIFLAGLAKFISGDKANKKILEGAYNTLSDLGEVVYRAKKLGIGALKEMKPVVGVPTRAMLAQRINDLGEVKKHIAGKVIAEYKYDGERVQAHIEPEKITLYSRRHENITHQFPDIVASLRKSFGGRQAIVDGEAAAVDEKSGRLKHFQVLMTRRRKYEIKKHVAAVPVKYFLFDLLYCDGRSFLKRPLWERKRELYKSFRTSDQLDFAQHLLTANLEKLSDFFGEALRWGAEGIMIKDAEGIYEAGTRGWKWIKFKKDYGTDLADTFDLVAVGGIFGAGRRKGTYGSVLGAVFDPKTGKYYSVTKVGAGLTDKDLLELRRRLDPNRLKEKHRSVETGIEADIWFAPAAVMEVAASEITVSPIHPAGQNRIKYGGLALRFPRFLRWREEKTPEQATTVEELIDLYRRRRFNF